MPLAITDTRDGVRFSVRVQPRASRSEVVGAYGTALRVRLLAPPVDGAANDELVALLADSLGVRREAVRIVAGATARAKVVEVRGVARDAVASLARGAL